MVDTPKSALLDLNVNTDDIHSLVNRAVLVGSLVATPPVRAYIARHAGVPAAILQIEAPRIPTQPLPRQVSGRSNGPTDLFRSTDQYRLDVQADPSVPFLDVYAQAPTTQAAGELANAAVDGLSTYLHSVGGSEGTQPAVQARIRQFGRAQGKLISNGLQIQVALLAFLISFALAGTAAIAVGRIKRGWRLAAA
jgi:hypothetical protein